MQFWCKNHTRGEKFLTNVVVFQAIKRKKNKSNNNNMCSLFSSIQGLPGLPGRPGVAGPKGDYVSVTDICCFG